MYPIILVRHAHPEDPFDPKAVSHWTDTRLSERGRREAACVAERLEREIAGRPCRVVSSDLKRAAETAQAICDRLKLPAARPERLLREFNNGVGSSLEAIVEAAHKAALANLVDPAEAHGETWAAFHGRVSAAMERVLRENDAITIVVSHYGTIINTVQWWLQLPLNAQDDTPVGFGANLTSISVLTSNKQDKHVLERLNDTAHLHAANIGLPLLP
jgi:broad specificity phosphatase PhoE